MERSHPVLGTGQPEYRTQTLCYGTKGSIEADIHETSVAASAPHRVAQYSAGAYTSARVDVINVGVLAPQLVPALAANQCSSCHNLASERSQVLTVCQCSVEFHSMQGS